MPLKSSNTVTTKIDQIQTALMQAYARLQDVALQDGVLYPINPPLKELQEVSSILLTAMTNTLFRNDHLLAKFPDLAELRTAMSELRKFVTTLNKGVKKASANRSLFSRRQSSETSSER
ncbi:hypothetical protein PHLCEN_2v10208 [Hermanssonia centrifuga]|uniref:Uncharacterized protein n=1 Tax=Hermanssonia centrifuga TaxID=98765 RepID=A0A2R6NNM2_9APHY|nr:hypothetical protein PHLCEN_2v10208 [Hermanssonia centrifuga]